MSITAQMVERVNEAVKKTGRGCGGLHKAYICDVAAHLGLDAAQFKTWLRTVGSYNGLWLRRCDLVEWYDQAKLAASLTPATDTGDPCAVWHFVVVMG